MGKRLSVIIVIIMVALMLATGITVGIFEYQKSSQRKVKLTTPDDLYFPEGLDKNEYGLFFYDQNGQRIRSTSSNVPFYNNKPLVLYIDGHANNLGNSFTKDLYNLQSWQSKGYNTAIFTWEALYNDDLYTAEQKIWGVNQDMRFFDKEDYQTKDVPKHSVSQTLVAYYYDFLLNHGYKDMEIRWQAHSLGASLAVAAANYLSELEQFEVIDKTYIPSRITLLDGLFTSQQSNIYIEWLDERMANGVEQAYKAIRKTKTMGVAFEYVKSSNELEIFLQNTQIFEAIKKEICYIDYDSEWLAGTGAELEKAKHNQAAKWYNLQLDYALPNDYAAMGFQQFGISPNTPTPYVYARMGTSYVTLESGEDISQDKQASRNADIPFVAGFAFEDKNKDGSYNGNLASRIDGIRVELYFKNGQEDRLIGTTLTKNGGYFQLPIEPIYITGTDGRDFYVKVAKKGDYNITQIQNGNSFLLNNAIGQNNKSQVFRIYTRSDLKIINIGLT